MDQEVTGALVTATGKKLQLSTFQLSICLTVADGNVQIRPFKVSNFYLKPQSRITQLSIRTAWSVNMHGIQYCWIHPARIRQPMVATGSDSLPEADHLIQRLG